MYPENSEWTQVGAVNTGYDLFETEPWIDPQLPFLSQVCTDSSRP